jgi:hypothetical protein
MILPPATAKPPATTWFLGLDLAQRQDFTALATLKLEWRITERCKVYYNWIRKPELWLCTLDRYEQGESYLAYCNMVERRIDQIRAREANSKIHLVIDASGPGAPIVDEFKKLGLKIDINPVTMTAGHESTANKHGGENVPRRALITNLILLLERGGLKAADGIPYLDEFQNEMLGLRANDTAAGATDDLVVATALAAWQANNTTPELQPHRERRRTYIAAGTRLLF